MELTGNAAGTWKADTESEHTATAEMILGSILRGPPPKTEARDTKKKEFSFDLRWLEPEYHDWGSVFRNLLQLRSFRQGPRSADRVGKWLADSSGGSSAASLAARIRGHLQD